MQNQYIYSALATVGMLKKIQRHAEPWKWTENNTGTAEQEFQLF